MKNTTTVHCKLTERNVHSFYLTIGNKEYYLFSQNYRQGVNEYFSTAVCLKDARRYTRCSRDKAIARTMNKLPLYIKYVEREYGIIVLEQTKRKHEMNCA